VAETLSKAKNTSVQGLAEAGILEARSGKVHLLRREELDIDWDPEKDKRLTAWESVQHLIHALDKNGEEAAGALLSHLGGLSETARDLAYRLYTICERKGWAQDALAYNMLVVAWPRLKELAARSNIFVKVSSVLRRVDGRVVTDLNAYRDSLDALWELFGVDRLIYGSDWPVSARVAPYAEVIAIVRRYFESKGREACEKYFWRNSRTAYRWRDRGPRPNGAGRGVREIPIGIPARRVVRRHVPECHVRHRAF